jgi:hypothetical protein
VRRRIALLVALLPVPLGAQGLRVSGVTLMQLIELRPLVIDSAPASTFSGTGEIRTTADGVPAVCSPTSNYCQFERSSNRVSIGPVMQDLTFAGWGWVEGLSFRANLRARGEIGKDSTFVFPRYNDHFDVLDAYAQLDRSSWQARLGRQWVMNGLGAYDFDGGDVLVRRDPYALEGWAGRALVEGLQEPYTTSQLAAVDNLPPQQNGYIFGARARFRPDPLSAAALTYQRVLIADRSGLYSERAAFDASTRRFGPAVDLDLTYDFAAGDWNEARLRVGTPNVGVYNGWIEARHSRPFFELWTIWGAFSPVGFDEARANFDWRPSSAPIDVTLFGGYQQYAPTNTGISLRTNGWRAGGDLTWLGSRSIVASASYAVDIGGGAAGTDIRANVRCIPSSTLSIGTEGLLTQNIYEFRIGTGWVYGFVGDVSYFARQDVRVVADAGLYQHLLTNGAPGPNWSQRRASIRFEFMVGRDPGMSSAQ